MIEPRFGDLEVLTRFPAGEPRPAPVLFIHGAYTGAWCWEPYFLPYFAAHGYGSTALSLRGHANSEGREGLRWYSIESPDNVEFMPDH